MKTIYLSCVLLAACFMSFSVHGQSKVVVNDPTVEYSGAKITPAEQILMDKNVLPKFDPAKFACRDEAFEIAGSAEGSFTKTGSKQKLILYQCETAARGSASVGAAVVENDKIVANYFCEDCVLTGEINALPDINQNGVDEIAVEFIEAMHVGNGGASVDIMEISAGRLKGIGGFTSNEYTDGGPTYGYKVTVKSGKAPTFFREAYIQNDAGKWRKRGRVAPLKLRKAFWKFEVVK